jgi:nucleoside 2-deoxyribosyltransferase
MMTLSDLANGKSLVYIVTRLFDFSEKIKAEKVEQAVLAGLQRAMQESGIKRVSQSPITFVPFRDTAQDKIEAPNKTKIIYEEDITRLKRLFAVVGFLDGLSKDEGVCMEMGYAYALGVPILIILTDFIRREMREFRDSQHLLDPVLLAMGTRIISEYQIPEIERPFYDRLILGLEHVYETIEREVFRLAISPSPSKVTPISEASAVDVYVDFGGGHFEWERILQRELSRNLDIRGISNRLSQRYAQFAEHLDSMPSCINVRDLGLKDIANAAKAEVVVTCGDSDEMSSGTAAIQGFARALGKKILLYDSRMTYLVGNGGHRMSRNLMIDYSADNVIREFRHLPEAIEKLLKT